MAASGNCVVDKVSLTEKVKAYREKFSFKIDNQAIQNIIEKHDNEIVAKEAEGVLIRQDKECSRMKNLLEMRELTADEISREPCFTKSMKESHEPFIKIPRCPSPSVEESLDESKSSNFKTSIYFKQECEKMPRMSAEDERRESLRNVRKFENPPIQLLYELQTLDQIYKHADEILDKTNKDKC